MKLVTLTDLAEISKFQSAYRSRAKANISIEYASNAIVRGFYKKRELIGGYIINHSDNKRYFSYIESLAERKEAAMRYSSSAEITCMWIYPRKMNLLQRMSVYTHSLLDAYNTEKAYVLAGCMKQKNYSIQKPQFPIHVWSGPALSQPSETQWVFACKRQDMLRNYVNVFLNYLRINLSRMFVNTFRPSLQNQQSATKL